MQEALPAFVLPMEPTMPDTRNDASRDANSDGPQSVASDEQLMAAFSRGSTDSFGELFSRYKQPMFGFFRRRLRDPAQAEELTQETFLALLRASSHYEPSATFRTYLYAIGFNILRAHRRKAAFRAMFHGTEREGREPAVRNTMDADLWLRDAVNRLERMDREILLLREFEQLSYAEIAELLRLPLNTVRSRLFRARTAVRELLGAQAPTSSTKDLTECEERV
jgi:RNA polymerase sigma-70 factor (ECF subfamily)